MDAIHAELYAGRKIQAIKMYREAGGGGLKESKDAVDAIEATLRARHPDRFDKISSRKGCMPVLLVATVAITAFLLLGTRFLARFAGV